MRQQRGCFFLLPQLIKAMGGGGGVNKIKKRRKKKAGKQKGGMWGWKIRDKILQLCGGKGKENKYVKNAVG